MFFFKCDLTKFENVRSSVFLIRSNAHSWNLITKFSLIAFEEKKGIIITTKPNLSYGRSLTGCKN